MNLLNPNAIEPIEVHKNTATIAVANDLRLMRTMSGPPVLRQAVAGLIHLAFTEESHWARHAQSRDFAAQFAALRLCRYALGEIQKIVSQSAANADEYHRDEIRGIARAVATPEEVTANIYWEAMEKLGAAGIDFEELLTYHYKGDGDTEF